MGNRRQAGLAADIAKAEGRSVIGFMNRRFMRSGWPG